MAPRNQNVEAVREEASSEMFNVAHTPGGQAIPTIRTNGSAGAPVAGRARDLGFENSLQSIRLRHQATGIEPATILNFLPIPLVVNSPMNDLKVRILPAPATAEDSDLFSFHTWQDPAIEVAERGEGVKQPVDYLPVQVAKAFVDEYASYGGVVLLRGLPDEKTLSRPEVVKQIHEAREKMNDWMLRRVEEANGEWNTVNRSGARNIVQLHRSCAARLKDLGLIDELPEWMVESRTLKEVQKKCPSCGSQPAVGAVRCSCAYVLDPGKAFLVGDITEEDASLERLTRAEVTDLGISAYVCETSDERPARLAAGAAKPLSIAQRRAMEAEQNNGREAAAL